jgi:Tfp pilus assembly protein PilX
MKGDNGFVLIAAVIILVLFTTLGVVGVSLLSTDIHIALDTLRSTQALFLAEAGMQYVLESLSNDSDWSDNSDILKSMANGTFNIQYITKAPNSATIKFTGTKENVTRKFTANFTKHLLAFNYAAYIGGEMHTQDATDLTITGEVQENATNLPTVDFSYYESIADHKIYQNQIFTAGTYTGIWYINGNVTVNSGVTINGTIITTGNINMNDNSNINVTATSPYPALIANGNFIFQNTNNITINGLIYVGADMSGNFNLQEAEDINITGVVIVAGNFQLQYSDDVTITYQPQDLVPGFSGIGVAAYNTWQEVN